MKLLWCFSKNKFPFNVIALLIRCFQPITKSSHMAVHDIELNLVYDFSFGGMRVNLYEDYIEMYDIIKTKQLSNKLDPKAIVSLLPKYEDLKYGKMQLVGNICKLVFKRRNPFLNGSGLLVCNEFALLIACDLGLIEYTDELESLDLDDTYIYTRGL